MSVAELLNRRIQSKLTPDTGARVAALKSRESKASDQSNVIAFTQSDEQAPVGPRM